MKERGFCRFYKKLYWGKSVRKRQLVKWRLYHGSGQLTIFCIKRAETKDDQLDIIHCAFLKQPFYRKNPAYIYGIAGCYDEALKLVVTMTEESINAGYDARIVEYLDSKK